MSYFEDLAADLDRARPSGTFWRLVEQKALSETLPFDLADEISVVPQWRNIARVDKTKTTYLATLGKWLTDGIDFDPNADYCCELAEQYLIESIRRDQHREFKEPSSEDAAKPQPAVIFTVGGTAVAYRKSVGVDTTYGLRKSAEHNIGAKVFATHTFEDAKFETDEDSVIIYELKLDQTFDPIRPAVTSFDLAERKLFARSHVLTSLEHAAMTLKHATVVRRVDAILQAHTLATQA